KQELVALKPAIEGNPSAVAGGEYIDRGFEGDVGFVPSQLPDLARKPDSVTSYDQISRLGWNGPYIAESEGEYLTDAWGNAYIYQPALRTIFSTGGGSDTIRITF
ncbi:MAG: type II secretion system protein GspG, partial [candidate division Zixibacteria bacterium]|nr:type II secretion system protein GspG [candidate division Zixibacteria bacterium]